MTAFILPPERSRLPDPYREELPLVRALAEELKSLNWAAVLDQARPWVQQVRANPAPFWAMESLLREYPITSAEGRGTTVDMWLPLARLPSTPASPGSIG